MKRIIRKYILEGLDCAGCAGKIEAQINGLDEVKEATLDFVSKRLTIEYLNSKDVEKVYQHSRAIIDTLEPHVQMVEKEENHHSHTHSHDKMGGLSKSFIGRLILGAFIFGVALMAEHNEGITLVFFLAAYVFIGGDVILKAVKNIFKGNVFDENFLMSIATLGAFAIKEYPEAVSVMLFYQIGEIFQSVAVNKSRRSISELINIRPDYANLKTKEGVERVAPEKVQRGDFILVKPGEKIPLDGTVVEGRSSIDTSALTGESIPRDVEEGDTVLSGFINKNGLLTMKVDKTFGESTVSKILDLVENANSRKAPTERFITKFARHYTPFVVYSALVIAILPPLFVKGALFEDWLYRALIFLVVSCPCALVVSIPLGFFGGIGNASKHGILVKGSNYLEALNQVKTVVFDKTGTLTKGIFEVQEVNVVNSDYSDEEILEFAAHAEHYSNHPIARSIVKAHGKPILSEHIDTHEEIAGKGIRVQWHGKGIVVGNRAMMELEGIQVAEPEIAGTMVYVSVDKSYAGYLVIADSLKEDAKLAIAKLRQKGIQKIIMLTGDHNRVAQHISDELGLDHYYAELLPQEKVNKLEELERRFSKDGKLIFAGDGVNDAPVLARADVGIAMGALGSDAAIEAADVVLMTDEPSKIAESIEVAQQTRRIVGQNIVFAIGVKGIVLLMGVGGIATMWEAVFADVGVALLAVLNAARILKMNMTK